MTHAGRSARPALGQVPIPPGGDARAEPETVSTEIRYCTATAADKPFREMQNAAALARSGRAVAVLLRGGGKAAPGRYRGGVAVTGAASPLPGRRRRYRDGGAAAAPAASRRAARPCGTRAVSSVPSGEGSARSTSPSAWARATRSPRLYGTTTQTSASERGSAASIASRSAATPAPVLAETVTLPGSRARSPCSTTGSAASALLITTSSGTCAAPISASTP